MIRRPIRPAQQASSERCPLWRAALKSGNPAIIAAVRRYHPPERCTARRAVRR